MIRRRAASRAVGAAVRRAAALAAATLALGACGGKRIENGVFHVRDVTLGEDGCRVRTGGAAMILSTMRNVVLNLLSRMGVTNKAAALRRHSAHPGEALALVQPSG